MSEENVEVFKRGAWPGTRDDFDAWIEQYDPEVEGSRSWRSIAGLPELRQAWENFKGDMQITVRFGDIRDSGSPCSPWGQMKSTGHTTGLNFTAEVAQLVTYRDGRTIRVLRFRSS